ncbi:MAG: Response regulator of zinc sigma-54-dependent two-component system [uncultured Thermomicrobiales bacterium]|uniref:Response regulator of zinc sigma-54-dependent two-component system n=1 Tax=uncultured Thermomicrobiales bacterium TaxID=1645740 RepID=A0A6J4U4V2_9BACT|nr:MAG: Response regulator of zinc sigma-54-dependent two-component system [uncultured Thermomicrobiales bacterium]
MARIQIVDDDPAIREVLRSLLEDEGFDVTEGDSGQSVLDALSADGDRRPQLVMMDVRMPDKNGLEVLREARGPKDSALPVIVMTAYGSSNVAIDAMRSGAYDYITKPFDLEDVLLTIQRFFDRQRLSEQVEALSVRLGDRDPNEIMIGNSPPMQEVYKTIGRIAHSDATVLITGETGTGKELIATILHGTSSYSRGPLVKVNCAALPESLLESELFGHEKGAFTGAINQRKGRFEMANKGTIFLDEIGEMTLSTQKKLLRVLQEREFERVGGSISVRIDTRVIAATNKILAQEIEAGRFREDLFYRLNVISLYLPPLRDRKEDIPLLVEHFVEKHRYKPGAGPSRVSQAAIDKLMSYDWPGNVRELENLVERATVMSQGNIITDEHITFYGSDNRRIIDISERVRRGASLPELQQDVEAQAISEALSITDGDRLEAAALLGIKVTELNKLSPVAG